MISEFASNLNRVSLKHQILGGETKPATVIPTADSVPPSLRDRKCWVIWRWRLKPGKWAKMPARIDGGHHNWQIDGHGSFDQALAACMKHDADGVGVVLGNGLAGVDVDDCYSAETGELTSEAQLVLHQLAGCYYELSPTKTGIKIFVLGDYPADAPKRRGKVEAYGSGRFFTFTGQRLPDSAVDISNGQHGLDWVANWLNKTPRMNAIGEGRAKRAATTGSLENRPSRKRDSRGFVLASQTSDDQLIERAMASEFDGVLFQRLWSGDTTGYESQSEADLSLIGLVGYWTNWNRDRMDRLFRASGLMRSKWDDIHSPPSTTYGQMTIEKAFAGRRDDGTGTELASLIPASPNGSVDASLDVPFDGTDVWLARRFVMEYRHQLGYCDALDRWYTFNGQRWRSAERCSVFPLVQKLLDKLKNETAALLAKRTGVDAMKEAEIQIKAIKNASRHGRILGVVEQAKGHLIIDASKFDRDHWKLNVLNGTIDLKSGEFHPHRREDMITKLVPLSYDSSASCPRWLRFIEQIMPNADDRACLKRILGSQLSGDTSPQKLVIFHGNGANGKSVLLDTVLGVVGNEYGMKADPGLLTLDCRGNAPHSTVKADLFGRRFVIVSELPPEAKLNEALVKELTGDGSIRAARKHKDTFEFEVTVKPILATNRLPRVMGGDFGIARRLFVVPFTQRFQNADESFAGGVESLPAADPNLRQVLLAEAPGILAWLVAGCVEWHGGNRQYEPSPLIRKATEQFAIQSDSIGAWLNQCCNVGDGLRQMASELHESYVKFCRESDLTIDSSVNDSAGLGRALSDRGFGTRHSGGSVRTGLALKS